MKVILPQLNSVLPMPMPNQELVDALLNRRSTMVKDIDAEIGPTGDELLDILKVASRVPDHGKINPWRFVKFSGDARRKIGIKMADIYKAKHPEMDDNHYATESARFERAHTILVLISSPIPHPKAPEFEQLMSAGGLGFAINLAANAFGYAATWLTEWAAFDDDIKPLFNMSENEKIIGFFFIGKPKTAPTERERPDVYELLTEWK
jgi:nitroreductase